jgi:hypothetical protein
MELGPTQLFNQQRLRLRRFDSLRSHRVVPSEVEGRAQRVEPREREPSAAAERGCATRPPLGVGPQRQENKWGPARTNKRGPRPWREKSTGANLS